MSFREFAKKIEDFIYRRKRVSFSEIMNYVQDDIQRNGFCFCDVMDVLHNLESSKKIEVRGNVIVLKD